MGMKIVKNILENGFGFLPSVVKYGSFGALVMRNVGRQL
jgi:hypothetical protein